MNLYFLHSEIALYFHVLWEIELASYFTLLEDAC